MRTPRKKPVGKPTMLILKARKKRSLPSPKSSKAADGATAFQDDGLREPDLCHQAWKPCHCYCCSNSHLLGCSPEPTAHLGYAALSPILCWTAPQGGCHLNNTGRQRPVTAPTTEPPGRDAPFHRHRRARQHSLARGNHQRS